MSLTVINRKDEKMKSKFLVVALASSLTLAGCASGQSPWSNWGMGNKQAAGSVAGAVAGGFAGSKIGGGSGQLWATGAGALLGAFVGSEIGKSLDRADRQYHTQATQEAYSAPIGQTISWDNPESGNYGSVTPVRERRTADSGQYCREYKQTIVVDGQAETAYGTACQDANGEWKLVN